MILLVADGAPAAVDAALADADVTTVSTTDAAKTPDPHPEVLLIHHPTIEDTPSFVEWLRSDQSWDPRVPLIILTTDSLPSALPLRPYDAVIAPTDEAGLTEAIENAQAVAGYRNAIDDLYDRCLDRADSGAGPLDVDPDVTEARDRADARLDALPDDPEIIAALLADPPKLNPD